MDSAVCIAIYNAAGEFLAVSRRNNTTQWGFPGGKVDPGESNFDAIIRETKEEVGIDLDPFYIEPIFVGECIGKKDGKSFWVTTYLYKLPIENFKEIENGLDAAFLNLKELCNPAKSPFAEYNVEVRKAYFTYGFRHV